MISKKSIWLKKKNKLKIKFILIKIKIKEKKCNNKLIKKMNMKSKNNKL